MDQNIIKLLYYATKAPSGDNIQPWLYKITKNKIHLYIHPDKSDVFDYKGIASYISAGMFIENIIQASKPLGFKAEFSINNTDKYKAGTITLKKTKPLKSSILNLIEKRCTDRFPYESKPMEYKPPFNEKNIHVFKKGTDNWKTMRKILYKADIIRLRNQKAHNILFSNIIFDTNELIKRKQGMFHTSLGLKHFSKQILKMMSTNLYFKISKLSKINYIEAFISTYMPLTKSSGLILITTPKYSKKEFINTGRIAQRIWLDLTKKGLSAQPFMSFPLFLFESKTNKSNWITKKDRNKILGLEETYKREINPSIPLFIFRYGIPKNPCIKSIRQDISKNLITKNPKK